MNTNIFEFDMNKDAAVKALDEMTPDQLKRMAECKQYLDNGSTVEMALQKFFPNMDNALKVRFLQQLKQAEEDLFSEDEMTPDDIVKVLEDSLSTMDRPQQEKALADLLKNETNLSEVQSARLAEIQTKLEGAQGVAVLDEDDYQFLLQTVIRQIEDASEDLFRFFEMADQTCRDELHRAGFETDEDEEQELSEADRNNALAYSIVKVGEDLENSDEEHCDEELSDEELYREFIGTLLSSTTHKSTNRVLKAVTHVIALCIRTAAGVTAVSLAKKAMVNLGLLSIGPFGMCVVYTLTVTFFNQESIRQEVEDVFQIMIDAAKKVVSKVSSFFDPSNGGSQGGTAVCAFDDTSVYQGEVYC